MVPTTETVEGYVIGVGCIRKNARDDFFETASTHTKECALMDHCVESGYGIVTEEDRLTVLDPEATRRSVDVVQESETQEGICLRVSRETRDGTMETVEIEEINQPGCSLLNVSSAFSVGSSI